MGAIVSGLNDIMPSVMTGASYVFDPANVFQTRNSAGPGPSPVPEETYGQHVGDTSNPSPLRPQVSSMGLASRMFGQGTPMAPPPPAHWGYTPGQGTSWMTPDKRLTADNQYSWNATSPGVAPGNRI